MSAPLAPMPFSVVWEPLLADTRLFINVQAMRNSPQSPSRLTLIPPGVSTVQVTWDGAEALLVGHRKVAYNVQIGSSVTIPAGVRGVYRTATLTTSSKTATWVSLDLLSAASAGTIDAGCTAGLSVFPTGLPS